MRGFTRVPGLVFKCCRGLSCAIRRCVFNFIPQHVWTSLAAQEPLLLRLQYHPVDYLWKPVATPLFVHNEPSSRSCLLLVFWEIRRAAKPIDVACPSASTSLRDSLLSSCSSLRCDRWRMKSGRRTGSHLASARHASNLRIHPGAHEML